MSIIKIYVLMLLSLVHAVSSIDINDRHKTSEKIEKLSPKEKLNLDIEMRSAIYNNDIKRIDELIQNGADLTIQDKYGFTTLHLAVQFAVITLHMRSKEINHIPTILRSKEINHILTIETIIESLLKYQGQNTVNQVLNMQDKYGETALFLALQKGNLALQKENFDVIKYLLNNGARIDIKNNTHRTPLVLALVKGDMNTSYQLTKCMIESTKEQANRQEILSVQDDDHLTALHYALGKERTDVAEMLIEAGARVDLKAKNGVTPIDIAKVKRFPNLVKRMENIQMEQEKKNSSKNNDDYLDLWNLTVLS